MFAVFNCGSAPDVINCGSAPEVKRFWFEAVLTIPRVDLRCSSLGILALPSPLLTFLYYFYLCLLLRLQPFLHGGSMFGGVLNGCGLSSRLSQFDTLRPLTL
jgi:hypothetical protein